MTFGNAVELILSIVALMKRLYDVVTYSLIGSVLSNLLLVLGKCCALWVGLQCCSFVRCYVLHGYC